MTIKGIASKYGVSVQAVYKRIRSAEISLDGLKDKQTGELTPEGEAAVMALFEPLNRVENSETELKAEVENLRGQVETLKSEVEYLRKALDNAQQLQAMALQRLALPSAKPGFFSRLFGRRKE